MDNWITPQPLDFNVDQPLFLCVLANTDTARIPGISAAGKSPEVIDYTPAGDAELVTLGRTICKSEPPMTPAGSPTPAVITRASLQLTGIPFMFINSGLRVIPRIPLLDVGAKPGKDLRTTQAVSDATLIYENSMELGRQLNKLSDCVIIGESVPGGTTTALCVLKALGVHARVSSSFPENPLNIKEQVIEKALQTADISFGDMSNDPIRAIEYFGDPMMPCVCGLVKGLEDTACVLAGGTQMMAVLALIKHLGLKNNVSIASTKFVAEDNTASFLDTVQDMGYRSYIADPGFKGSRNPGLRMYESGDVKEGVGAGGGMFAAGLMGITQKKFREQVELVCDQVF
jgi:uncharacterized protein (TIGR00303 family)